MGTRGGRDFAFLEPLQGAAARGFAGPSPPGGFAHVVDDPSTCRQRTLRVVPPARRPSVAGYGFQPERIKE